MKPVKKEVLGQDAMAAVDPEMSCSNREAIPDIERLEYKEYGFQGSGESHMHARFMPRVLQLSHEIEPCVRVLDVGCGNGLTCGEFIKFGCEVVGIDLSRQGIEIARKLIHKDDSRCSRLTTDCSTNLGEAPFDIVVSTEVIEHLYSPREYTQGCFRALRPGGRFICTTPYHGYLKNLVLSLAGKWDSHANPLWDGGHIKLWSRKTLTRLLTETGFTNLRFHGAGRMPYLWMTMVMSGDKPER